MLAWALGRLSPLASGHPHGWALAPPPGAPLLVVAAVTLVAGTAWALFATRGFGYGDAAEPLPRTLGATAIASGIATYWTGLGLAAAAAAMAVIALVVSLVIAGLIMVAFLGAIVAIATMFTPD